MSDKKIIISALILAALLIGGAWYYSRSPIASISNVGDLDNFSISEAGILIGDPDAPVIMEEYTSFVCPACASFSAATLDRLIEDYVKPGKVKMIFYVLPPELGPAALCAEEQNKFMEFHDYVFEHQTQITAADDMKTMAVNAGLSGQEFNACFGSGKYDGKVDNWVKDGIDRRVQYTPTFYINGQELIGAQPYGDFKKIIDEKLDLAQ